MKGLGLNLMILGVGLIAGAGMQTYFTAKAAGALVSSPVVKYFYCGTH